MIYTEDTPGGVPTDDLQVGDVINILWARAWGPVTAIYPYQCSTRCTTGPHGPDGTCALHHGDRVARFANGLECTLEPGGRMFPN